MKLVTRFSIVVLFVLALAKPALAQNPYLAVRILPPASAACFPVTIKNVHTAPIATSAAYLVIIDQKTCKRTCESKMALAKKLAVCQSLTFRICCDKPLPPQFIAWVKVTHSAGMNEQWFYKP